MVSAEFNEQIDIQTTRSNQVKVQSDNMAADHYLQSDFIEDEASLEKWKSLSSRVDESEANPSGGFECNICLDAVQDPVVTICGHLYCWSCIYRWINRRNNDSPENPDQQQPQCPVCKSELSEKTLIPLYGRGRTTSSSASDLGILVPRRPPSPRCGFNMLIPNITTGNSLPAQRRQQSYVDPSRPFHPSSPMIGIGRMTPTVIDPVVGMFGEMAYSRIFGNWDTTPHTYPNSYHLAGSSSPRVRRHILRTDKSLSRVCFFLFCCVMLCLVLF
ncbi:E3 ubiquitin-protein ligase RMA1H1-like isoform X1 [Olea europaea var. sylvestris]|uniref:E3 ubiquitin-protein ligase RMA1H1-like isoform X1 n=2 Tax=Olea europaea var. sylvestris TaxID=158386 RepID=UPI000C1D28DF|nr:E3 ubiquitin-protein ligase RMA1H1-like isoform X1 [Olea europaea var. sylvestris]XP_022847807.1 E3 ubiquitin-protein ligase RMA1H1-like isoform X1 [Olea europaea var. sylvestris]